MEQQCKTSRFETAEHPDLGAATILPTPLRLGRYRTILDAVAAHAARGPDKPFLIIETQAGTEICTFAALQTRAMGYAEILRRRGVTAGDTVAIMLTTHSALAPAFLGAIAAGGIPFLLPTISAKQDPALFWAAQFATMARAAPRVIVTDRTTVPLLETYMASNKTYKHENVIDADGIDLADLPAIAAAGIVLPDIAFLQHSSGTTGAKKGVVLSHRMVLDAVAALAVALQIEDADIIASWLPLYHDMGLIACLILPMLLGLTAVHCNPFDWVAKPMMLFDMIARHRATLCWQPNFAFQHLVRLAPKDRQWDLSSMRAFINCSESCKPETITAFRNRFRESGLRPQAVQVSYGMAENVFATTQTDLAAVPRSVEIDLGTFHGGQIVAARGGETALGIMSTGVPIPGTQVAIWDAQEQALPERALGQIAVCSPYLFKGYFADEAASRNVAGGWYRTGDFGFLDGGELFVCGRRDELLIINGRNIYAPDIEFAINRHTAVKPGRCVAIGPYNPRTGSQSLIVIAETVDDDESARRALSRAIQELVNAEFGFQTHEVWVTGPGWILKTTSGKAARGANEAKYVRERWTK